MQRPSLRTVTTSIYPLLGLAALMAASGCAAVPALSMANSLLKPAQPALAAAPSAGMPSVGSPAPDIFSALAQRLGITQPAAQGTKTTAAQTALAQTALAQTALAQTALAQTALAQTGATQTATTQTAAAASQ